MDLTSTVISKHHHYYSHFRHVKTEAPGIYIVFLRTAQVRFELEQPGSGVPGSFFLTVHLYRVNHTQSCCPPNVSKGLNINKLPGSVLT